jgi:hypothetical protein
MNVLNCLTEKSDFIRSAMMYNVGYIAAGSDKNSPDGMAEISGGDFNVNYTFLKDPFFFLPHVIGSGPAAVEWFAGGGIGLDFGFGFRSLSRTSKAWSDVYSDSSAYRGDITDLRFVWNNAVSAGGFVRLFDGTLSVTGLYSKYFPHASLLNLGFTSVDVPEKDTTYNKPWKFSDYEYEFDQDHAGQNLFGLGNFIASGYYEGGYSTTITARASVPVNVRPVTDWFIRQSEKTGNIKPWQRMFKTYLGISLNFTRSSHEYSIKKGRDKLGVTNPANNGHLIEDDGMYYYDVDQNSISIMLDMSINSDYVALGAR